MSLRVLPPQYRWFGNSIMIYPYCDILDICYASLKPYIIYIRKTQRSAFWQGINVDNFPNVYIVIAKKSGALAKPHICRKSQMFFFSTDVHDCCVVLKKHRKSTKSIGAFVSLESIQFCCRGPGYHADKTCSY